MAKDPFLDVLIRIALGKFVVARKGDFGSFKTQTKVLGQSGDVLPLNDDTRIAAAVAGARAAVE